MVGADDLNLHALGGGAEILNCHARRDQRAPAAQVGIGARHVVQDPDPDGAVGVLRLRPEHPRATASAARLMSGCLSSSERPQPSRTATDLPCRKLLFLRASTTVCLMPRNGKRKREDRR